MKETVYKYGMMAVQLLCCVSLFAQNDAATHTVGGAAFDISLRKIGTIRPRNTAEIASSNWILGCETLDRDMADYHQYKEYIAPLGIKRLRMQAGWAKTEKKKGVYDWAWLDAIINDAAGRGFQPWLETSYGNPIYNGGGGVTLSGGIPVSDTALKAWDKWVAALVHRYKTKVKDWEVWNEPNFGDNEINLPEKVAELNIRTAEIIKRIQPEAKISGLAMGHINLDYADRFFKVIHRRGKMHLFDNMTYHDYVYNPDANYGHVAELRRVLDKYSTKVALRQGENGSPSQPGFGRGALGDWDWNEQMQAKWNTRRMLGDLGHDIESSILGIVDMNYPKTGPITRQNVKGLLQADSTNKVLRPKLVYGAMQHVVSVFDNRLQRIKNLHYSFNSKQRLAPGEVRYVKSTDRSLAVYGYENKSSKKQVFVIWVDEYIPTASNATRDITFTVLNGAFTDPVYVDLLTGGVFQIAPGDWSKEGDNYIFKKVPVYDAPVLIADKSLIEIKE